MEIFFGKKEYECESEECVGFGGMIEIRNGGIDREMGEYLSQRDYKGDCLVYLGSRKKFNLEGDQDIYGKS